MMGIKDGFVKLIARQGSGTVHRRRDRRPKASELIYPIAVAVERRLTRRPGLARLRGLPVAASSITDASRAMHVVDNATI